MKFNETYFKYLESTVKTERVIPSVLYHVTPFADKILKEGFKIGMSQVFGDAGAKSGISFFDDKNNAEYYKLGLQYHIAWANGNLNLDELAYIGVDFNIDENKIKKLISDGKDKLENHYPKRTESDIVKDAMETIIILSKGKFPWILNNKKVLSSLDIEKIDTLKITFQSLPTEYEYKSSESEWRVYDIETLNKANIKKI